MGLFAYNMRREEEARKKALKPEVKRVEETSETKNEQAEVKADKAGTSKTSSRTKRQ